MTAPIAIPGRPLGIGAADWNDLLAMLGQWKRIGRHLRGAGGFNTKGGIGGGSPLNRVLMRNDTGSDVPLFGVLAMHEPVITDAANFVTERFSTPVFKGIVPTSSYWGKWAVLQEPAPYEAGNPMPVYWGVCAGPTWANVNITDADDVAVEHNNATNELITGMHGSARILWKESGTGTGKIARILMGDWVSEFVGKANSAIASGASGTISVWVGTPGSETDSGVDVASCYNRTEIAIGSGTWCKVTSILGRLYAEPWECP